jgi:hypothetical protein
MQDPIQRITNTRRAGGMSQAVDYMPSKHKALSLNPVPQKTSLKKQKTVASI